jgi:hypothetical protein
VAWRGSASQAGTLAAVLGIALGRARDEVMQES